MRFGCWPAFATGFPFSSSFSVGASELPLIFGLDCRKSSGSKLISKGEATDDETGEAVSELRIMEISTSAEGRGASGNSTAICWAQAWDARPQNRDPESSDPQSSNPRDKVKRSAGRKGHSL